MIYHSFILEKHSTMMMESCTDLWELGPPPNFILSIPPPPVPENIHLSSINITTPYGLICDVASKKGEIVESAPQGRLVNDDSWVFIFFACGLLVLICSFAIALFFVKYKESREKISLHEEHLNSGKACETVLYPPNTNDKYLWATITPKGTTQHFTIVNPSVCIHKNSFENTAFDSDDYFARKPKVSLPTRIENPNIPPLNLYPTLGKGQQALL
uniref:Uncharacterized protein n=1 Tax=Cacopsylla melanoneura TaxID=428564 RepID=A0A8D8T1L8_9HEMI